METVTQYQNVPDHLKGCTLAIGNFDGVHRGHQEVLNTALKLAHKQKMPAGVMAFEPHPRAFFQPKRPLFRLTSLPGKLDLFTQLGLDLAAVMPFNADMASLLAEDFVSKVLVDGFDVRHVITGFNFFFG